MDEGPIWFLLLWIATVGYIFAFFVRRRKDFGEVQRQTTKTLYNRELSPKMAKVSGWSNVVISGAMLVAGIGFLIARLV